jgi:hypothetical protein
MWGIGNVTVGFSVNKTRVCYMILARVNLLAHPMFLG